MWVIVHRCTALPTTGTELFESIQTLVVGLIGVGSPRIEIGAREAWRSWVLTILSCHYSTIVCGGFLALAWLCLQSELFLRRLV